MTSSTPLDAKEIRSLMSDLEKAGGSTDKVVSLLTIFDERVQPTEKLLRETKLGIAVNKYRSHSDKKVAELVKKIVKKWKDQVSAQKNTSKSKQSNPASSSSATSSSSNHNNGSHSSKGTSVSSTNSHGSAKSNSTNNTNKSGSSVNKSRTPASDGIKTNVLNDRVRDPCIDLLYKALAIDSSEPGSQILECAKDIEEAVFVGENGTTKGYRQKILSLVSNLKDSRNPNLRGRVLSGEISGKVLYNMKPHEMASDDVKKDIEKIKKENLFNAQGAEEKRAVTDRFTCGKCKQKKVSYFQMQTRSADEPLTTFCTCENCGNRWKFS